MVFSQLICLMNPQICFWVQRFKAEHNKWDSNVSNVHSEFKSLFHISSKLSTWLEIKSSSNFRSDLTLIKGSSSGSGSSGGSGSGSGSGVDEEVSGDTPTLKWINKIVTVSVCACKWMCVWEREQMSVRGCVCEYVGSCLNVCVWMYVHLRVYAFEALRV